MSNLAEMLAKLDAPPASTLIDNQVISPPEHLALANGGTESDKVVSLFWPKDRFNHRRYDAAEETADSESLKSSEGGEGAEEVLGIPFLKIVGTIFLTAIAVGVWYSQLRMHNHAFAPVEPAPVAAVFTPGSTTLQETTALPDTKPPLVQELPAEVDDASWNDTLSQFEKFVTQQEPAGENKDKQAANEQLLNRLETWMNDK